MDTQRTDPLLSEKQHLIQLIYDKFQSAREYLGTMRKFYRTGRQLGQGAFGRVILAQHKLTTHFVAIKCLKQSDLDNEKIRVRVQNEMQILAKLQHPNIVHLFDSFKSKSHVCFVMELCGPDLLTYISRRKRLTESIAAFMFKQVCQAVEYCHSQSVAHRDIKPENLLLREEGKVKLCDFGFSKVIDKSHYFSEQVGTLNYMSP